MRTRNANTTHEGGRGRERKGREGEGHAAVNAKLQTRTRHVPSCTRGIQIRIQINKIKYKALRGEGIGRANACAMSNGRERARSSARAS